MVVGEDTLSREAQMNATMLFKILVSDRVGGAGQIGSSQVGSRRDLRFRTLAEFKEKSERT